jgi:hypothetical protein
MSYSKFIRHLETEDVLKEDRGGLICIWAVQLCCVGVEGMLPIRA